MTALALGEAAEDDSKYGCVYVRRSSVGSVSASVLIKAGWVDGHNEQRTVKNDVISLKFLVNLEGRRTCSAPDPILTPRGLICECVARRDLESQHPRRVR